MYFLLHFLRHFVVHHLGVKHNFLKLESSWWSLFFPTWPLPSDHLKPKMKAVTTLHCTSEVITVRRLSRCECDSCRKRALKGAIHKRGHFTRGIVWCRGSEAQLCWSWRSARSCNRLLAVTFMRLFSGDMTQCSSCACVRVSECLAYSCFTQLMKRMSQNFPNGGAMDTHFANMRSLIQVSHHVPVCVPFACVCDRLQIKPASVTSRSPLMPDTGLGVVWTDAAEWRLHSLLLLLPLVLAGFQER